MPQQAVEGAGEEPLRDEVVEAADDDPDPETPAVQAPCQLARRHPDTLPIPLPLKRLRRSYRPVTGLSRSAQAGPQEGGPGRRDGRLEGRVGKEEPTGQQVERPAALERNPAAPQPRYDRPGEGDAEQ